MFADLPLDDLSGFLIVVPGDPAGLQQWDSLTITVS